MPTFDGANKLITLDSGVTSVDVVEVYSAWKLWVKQGNAGVAPAFRVIGGDPLGGGLFAGSYFFLQNQSGWRIKPPEENITIDLRGNLYAENAGLPVLLPTDGAFNTSIRLSLSSLTQQTVVSTGSGLSAEQDQILRDLEDNAATARKMLTNRASISNDNAVTTIYDDDGTTPLRVFDHADQRNRAPR